ncbi:MAG: hypothetical protein ACI9J3_002057 [Parvicellaceae bacterium]|jgi:hypothetical protein
MFWALEDNVKTKTNAKEHMNLSDKEALIFIGRNLLHGGTCAANMTPSLSNMVAQIVDFYVKL